ncbi:Flp family type IVb pilin [Candidatus Liberibacter solanacearum]|uniref:Flp family type IVb pilin n=1 Tax=Candidatus Liberibacter solanacearum TaxID=556287 RepID=UPI0012685055
MIRKFLQPESGVTAIGYGLIAVLISVVGLLELILRMFCKKFQMNWAELFLPLPCL